MAFAETIVYPLFMINPKTHRIADRFRGFLPIVIDVETGGFEAKKHALLEMAAQVICMEDNGVIYPGELFHEHVVPFDGAQFDPKSLEITGIDPHHPFRFAIAEDDALNRMFKMVHAALKKYSCSRAILVGHNPAFDLAFLNAAIRRTRIKNNPFHQFTTFDTATLGGLAVGQTVLAKAVQAIGLKWDQNSAHSAKYDTLITAQLFCKICNQWLDFQSAQTPSDEQSLSVDAEVVPKTA